MDVGHAPFGGDVEHGAEERHEPRLAQVLRLETALDHERHERRLTEQGPQQLLGGLPVARG